MGQHCAGQIARPRIYALNGRSQEQYLAQGKPDREQSNDGHLHLPILAADTTVDIDGVILGQPVDTNHARAMLLQLSGRTHQVHTGVTVLSRNGEHSQVVSSAVTFLPLTMEQIDGYLATGESAGKAGAYAIQGHGAALVEATVGSMSNIIGLPLDETLLLLAAATE